MNIRYVRPFYHFSNFPCLLPLLPLSFALIFFFMFFFPDSFLFLLITPIAWVDFLLWYFKVPQK